jgi:YidC/Oxa1 family membrane protein insertase
MDRRSIVFLLSVSAAFFLIQLWYGPQARVQHVVPEQETVAPTIQAVAQPSPHTETAKPSYYVLENGYQQLVFSSIGGSLLEINLPFRNKNFPDSAVLPVEADRKMREQSPKEDMFPAVPAKRFDGSLLEPTLDTYYPLLRRLHTKEPTVPAAAHAAFALTSQYAEFAALPYTATSFTPTSITFEARQPHRIIKKRFSFPKDPSRYPYCFDVEIDVEGDRNDVWLTSGIPEVELMSGASGAALKYRVIRGTKSEVEKIDLPKTAFSSSSIQPDWVCNSNGFFGVIMDPVRGGGTGLSFSMVPGAEAPTRLLHIDAAEQTPDAAAFPGYEAKVPLSATEPTLQLRVFAGPFADRVLTAIDEHSLADSSKPTNYEACQSFHGWFAFISEPFAKFIFFLMKIFHRLFGSWGLSIVLVTIFLRILLYPLNRWSMRSMRGLQEISPLVKAIQEKYRKDPQKAQLEVMALYREKKVNPFGGCLPMLIQMPFLIGMFDLLRSSFELRGTPLIPGWIDNLAAPDVALDWKYHIPLLGSQLHILPLILGATMWWQQNLSSSLPKDPRQWSDQQRQQRAMGTIMTVVMTVLFYQFPAGLNIYWISSMLLGILQQWWTNRSFAKSSV